MDIDSRMLALGAGTLLLMGCTAEPQPTESAPSASASASATACDPSTATITWGDLEPADPAEVGYRSLTVDSAGFRITSDTEQPWASTVVSDDAAFTADDAVGILVASLNETGESVTELGDPAIDFDQNSVDPDAAGEFIIGYTLEQVQAPFTASCGARPLGSGTLITSGGGLGSTLVACGQPAVGGGDYAVRLLTYCAPA